jgi:hypothetical protein
LQGLLVDADGRPITLDTTRFHSALGQIRDKIITSGELQRLEKELRGIDAAAAEAASHSTRGTADEGSNAART